MKLRMPILFLFFLLFCDSAKAETVFVKYQGEVSLDGFRCVQTDSAIVHRICYRDDKLYLIVLLNSTYYHYCNIPESVVDQWLAAPSQGIFYTAYIKGNFGCRLGGIPKSE